jgi:hypothetical protein
MKSTQITGQRIVLLAAVATLLLLGVAASAQPGGGYVVDEGVMAGGSYRLTSASLPGSEPMIGGGYQLLSLAESTATGSGCCCTYLPCIPRNW